MSDYKTRNADLADRLVALPETGNQDADAGKHLSAFLGDVGSAWIVANAEERNRLAQQLFASVVVQNRAAVALLPRPDLLPFFEGVTWCMGGSDGGRGRVLELFSPRRVLIPDLRPSHHQMVCGSGLRYARRARRLTPTDESAIRALAGTRSLRSLAADFGVSHETVRAVVRAAGHPD